MSGSLASLAALRHGIAHARRADLALITVLAWQVPEGEAAYRLLPEPAWVHLWFTRASQRLDRAFDEAAGGYPRDIRIERHLVQGDPGPALCAIATSADDLLILGAARPPRMLAALHRRPVHRSVLAKAACPVLTVPGPHLLIHEAAILRRCGG